MLTAILHCTASVPLAALLRFAIGDFYPAVICTAIAGRFWPGTFSNALSVVAVEAYPGQLSQVA